MNLSTDRTYDQVHYDRIGLMFIDRLRESINPDTGMFDRQLRDRRWDLTYGSEAITSTAICLIAIKRAGLSPETLSIDPESTMQSLIRMAGKQKYSGAMGLVTWANAVWNGMPLEQIAASLGCKVDDIGLLIKTFTTMEVAWLLTGLVHESRRHRDPILEKTLSLAGNELMSRYQPTASLMMHATPQSRIKDRLRKHVANFADQIYSVYALSLASDTTANRHMLNVAEACATRLVELQGALGQWWWHYDAREGTVLQHYPVYSVHQFGMAPFALMALANAGGPYFGDAINRGRSWIAKNETGESMIDPSMKTIWRNIYCSRTSSSQLFRKLGLLFSIRADSPTGVKNLSVNYETRPYEWGWFLFAEAEANGS